MTGPYGDLTAPIIAETLADKVALIEQHQPAEASGWAILADSDVPPGRWVLRWDRVELRIGATYPDALGELKLARAIAAERLKARRALRRIVVSCVDDLGLPRRQYLTPAPLVRPA